MSAEARNAGYLFGCCAACRAPFKASDERLFGYKETQTVYYLLARFRQVSDDVGVSSRFTNVRQGAHVYTQAHVRPALAFARRIPEAQLGQAIPGWDAAAHRRQFRQGSFRMETNTRRSRADAPRDDEVAVDPDVLAAVRTAREAADDGADPADVDLAIINSIQNASPNVYRAVWDAPMVGVGHRELAQWVQDTDVREFTLDLNGMLAFCKLCNDIWDCFSRLSLTLRDPTVVPAGSVYVRKGLNNTVSIPSGGTAAVHTLRLGCLAAYYAHGCLLNLHTIVTDANKFDARHRDALLALLWLPLHAHCMYQEMNSRAAGQPAVKGAHNYLGCLDVIISQFLYVMASVDPEHAFAGFPFERFHVFYMKELAEAPPPLWDPAHRRVHDCVFDDGYRAAGTPAAMIEYASVMLVRLYMDRVKPLLDFMTRPAAPASPVAAAAQRFFLTPAEADALVDGFLADAARNLDNLKIFLDRAGGGAVLWQLQRGLRDENEKFQRELGTWMRRRMQAEWRNIAANQPGAGVTLREAQLVYLLMHTRDSHADLPAVGAAPPTEALALARDSAEDPADALQAMRDAGRCSMWKAAQRLRAWNFTRERPPEPDPLDDAGDDDSGGDSDGWTGIMPPSRRGRVPRARRLTAAAADDLSDSFAALAVTTDRRRLGGSRLRRSGAALHFS